LLSRKEEAYASSSRSRTGTRAQEGT